MGNRLVEILIVGILILIVIVVATCSGPAIDNAGTMVIRRWHDDEKSVTCWLAEGSQKGGISCLPDSQIRNALE